jgi:hypothetical protein
MIYGFSREDVGKHGAMLRGAVDFVANEAVAVAGGVEEWEAVWVDSDPD